MSKNGSPRPENHVIVLFGATGDLARRRLLPGLFHLHAAGLLPREYRVIGSSPPANALTDWQFRERAEQACADLGVTNPGPGKNTTRDQPERRTPARSPNPGRRGRNGGFGRGRQGATESGCPMRPRHFEAMVMSGVTGALRGLRTPAPLPPEPRDARKHRRDRRVAVTDVRNRP